MSTEDPYQLRGHFLDVDVRCRLLGPQLTAEEELALQQLVLVARLVDARLYAHHDPQGFLRWTRQLAASGQLKTMPQEHFMTLMEEAGRAIKDATPGAKIIPLVRKEPRS